MTSESKTDWPRIFDEKLEYLGYGHGLWPCGSDEHDIFVGAVGFFEDGKFIKVFDARQKDNLPSATDGAAPSPLVEGEMKRDGPPSLDAVRYYRSKGVTAVDPAEGEGEQ